MSGKRPSPKGKACPPAVAVKPAGTGKNLECIFDRRKADSRKQRQG
jgi:hypothetical protein